MRAGRCRRCWGAWRPWACARACGDCLLRFRNTFFHKHLDRNLAAELMGRYSNLVLIQSGKIIDALKRVDFEDSEIRQLLPGLPYTLPPKPNKPDFLATSAAAMVTRAAKKSVTRRFDLKESLRIVARSRRICPIRTIHASPAPQAGSVR